VAAGLCARGTAIAAVGLVALTGPARAEEPRAPGRVVGVVRLVGERPGPGPSRAVTVDPAVCGASVPDESLVVEPGGGVKDAVVVVRGAAGGTAPATEVLVDNRGCRFVPRVQVVVRGQSVRVRNSDPVLHNAHPVVAGPPEVSVANLALAREGQSMDLTRRLAAALPPAGETLVRLGCDVHPWMVGWLSVVDTPHAAVTDTAGGFTIADVPPGARVLAVWHERLGRREQPIVVPAEATIEVEVRLGPAVSAPPR
jgi:hypothetical protein